MSPDTDSALSPGPGSPGDRLLPWRQVRDITGLSRTTAWRRQKAGDFPVAVQISPGRVGWWESELTAWKTSRAPRQASPRSSPASTLQTKPPTSSRSQVRVSAPKPPATPAKTAPALKRRGRRGCEGQIAFDF